MLSKMRMAATLAMALGVSGFAFAQEQYPTSQPEENRGAQTQTSGQDQMQTSGNNKFDQNFVKKAAQGGKAEVELAELAMQKASDPQVKQLAEKIKKDHEQANQKLQQIAQTQNMAVSDELPKDAAKMKDKLSNMEGQEFDRAYSQFLVKEHKKDIKEFQKASEKASDPQLKDFAQSTLPTLQEHLKEAQQITGQTEQSQARE